MFDAVFISDLHLHPRAPLIAERFDKFVNWAAQHTRCVYILGDFLHAWPGDDALDPWSQSIAARLHWLTQQGIKLYFMPGNRDFLVGQTFLQLAHLEILPDPSKIRLGNQCILLSHGDSYCTKDHAHQWLRRLTRNTLFTSVFLRLPYRWRASLVQHVRVHSQSNRKKSYAKLQVVASAFLKALQHSRSRCLIHGHIHQVGHTKHVFHGDNYHQYVLSDWDDEPTLLCYNNSIGFKFTHI